VQLFVGIPSEICSVRLKIAPPTF